MKKIIVIACLAGSAFIILDSMNAAHALFMFFLAGIIPGTTTVIEASRMLEGFAILIGFTLSRVVTSIVRMAMVARKEVPTPNTALTA